MDQIWSKMTEIVKSEITGQPSQLIPRDRSEHPSTATATVV